MLPFNPALEFYKTRPNIDKIGAEIKVRITSISVAEGKKQTNKQLTVNSLLG